MSGNAAEDDDPWFGRWARSLNPRGLHRPGGRHERAHPSDEVALVFRPEGSAEVRELCDALEGPDGMLTGTRTPRGTLEIVARFRRADWVRTAGRSQAAAALLAASDATAAHPAPPRIMGVVNVTPDSFSDGGRFAEPARAVEHGLALADEGADVLDVGGESTRPGSAPVGVEVELARVVPVVAALARGSPTTTISVDTQKAEVARAALDAGASIVNDVSAGRADPAMLALVAERGAGFVAMHMQGTPRDMQRDPKYDDVVADVLEFLRARVRACLAAGIARERIWIDPGIGFGKSLEHNLELLRRLSELRSLGLPVCLGVSRKSFLARLSGDERSDRSAATAAAVSAGVLAGAEILRVHEVARMREAARVAAALRG